MTDNTQLHDRIDCLESLIEEQQETIETQHEQLASQGAILARITDDGEAADPAADEEELPSALPMSRRTVLQTGGVIGLLGMASTSASAQPPDHGRGNSGGNSRAINWKDADGDDLLEPADAAITGIDVADVQTDSLNGDITEGSDLTSLLGNGLTTSGNELTAALGNVLGFDDSGNIEIKKDTIDADELADDTVTVAGNTVSLGGSTGIDHGDLDGIVSSDHHSRPSAGDGLTDDSDTFNIAAGDNLSIDGSGVLNATDTHTLVSDSSGTPDDVEADDIEFGSDLSVADNGSGDVSVGVSGILPWNDSDNDTLLEAPGFDGIDVDFVKTPKLGTTGNSTSAFEAVVDDERFLRVTPTTTDDASNILVGHPSNTVLSGVVGATIAGGGVVGNPNIVDGDYGTIGGGFRNAATEDATVGGGINNKATGESATIGGGGANDATGKGATVGGGSSNEASSENATVGGGLGNDATALQATVGGGSGNEASERFATVSGGQGNDASGLRAVVGGGEGNEASGEEATVSGGAANDASGENAVVSGGASNTADGDYSFAAGRRAKTNGHDGAFVLGDSSNNPIQAQNDDEIRSQMPIYAPSINSTSARATKTNIASVDPQTVLAGVEQLAVKTWEFTDTDDGRHIGPMAEDFHEAFDIDGDNETIATVDADGIALAAIQGLSQKLDEKTDRIDHLEAENEALQEKNETLHERLVALDERVAGIEETGVS
ncbi:MAG: tail fiber domain-containing protein [Halobacteriales archaeon]